MNTPSIAEQLRQRGHALPHPQKQERAGPTPLKRTSMGEKKRQMIQWELMTYPTFERTLRLHRLDFWHCVTAQTSQPGWPDYAIFGTGWHAFVELKGTNLETKRVGKLRPDQERWRDTIHLANGEWYCFTLPADWHEVDVWLNGHTGKGIWGTWRTA